MHELEYAIDVDRRTGARAYSFDADGTQHLVGFGLRTLSSSEHVSRMLEYASRTGLVAFGNEVLVLDQAQQDVIADPDARSRLVEQVQNEHRFGSYVFEATSMPFDEAVWQRLTLLYSPGAVFRALASDARERGALGGVAYPIAPASATSTTLERGPRYGGVEPESLDRFLDLVIGWSATLIEQDPHRAPAPLTSGPSYLFEREVVSCVFSAARQDSDPPVVNDRRVHRFGG